MPPPPGARDGPRGLATGAASARRPEGDGRGTLPIDWPRTLAARGAGPLMPAHLRRRPAEARHGVLHAFLLDCSASMGRDGHLARAKGLLIALMEEAYRRRDTVALWCFAGDRVELRRPPQRAAAWNDDWIAPIAAGGGTPLTHAVAQVQRALARAPQRQRCLWLLTDGRTRERPQRPLDADQCVIIDFEGERGSLGRARKLAQLWSCSCRSASELAASV